MRDSDLSYVMLMTVSFSPLDAVVRMKRMYVLVREQVGSVAVCAVLELPGSVAYSFTIHFNFDLQLSSASVYYGLRTRVV